MSRPPCSFPGCDRPGVILVRGLCGQHAKQERAGRPLTALRARNGAPTKTDRGYLRVRVGGRAVLQHRHLMSQTLGRPLFSDESVHHRNGVRNDNRPENLELRVGAHGPGLSPEDAVEWAREILRRYAC